MQPEEQITIKDIILKIISIFKSIIKNWKIVLLFGIIGGALGFLYDYKNQTDPTYKSLTQFYLETAVPTNDYGGFASMLGGGGGGGGGLFSGENLLTLIKSTDFMEKILLREITIAGKKHIMCNYFYQKNRPEKKEAEKKEKVKEEYVFLKHTNKEKFTLPEFNSLAIVKGPAIVATNLTAEDKSSFMNLSVVTFDDTLSKVYADVFLETLREYYIDSKTDKIKNTIKRQERIVDSLRYLSQANESALARVKDQYKEAVFEQGHVLEQQLTRKSQMLTNSFSEQERSLQNLKLQLYQDSPLFKITSPQRFPLSPSGSSLTKNYKTGIYIGIFVSLIFIVLFDAIREIMKDGKS
jgi:hypothetical protein